MCLGSKNFNNTRVDEWRTHQIKDPKTFYKQEIGSYKRKPEEMYDKKQLEKRKVRGDQISAGCSFVRNVML